MKFSTLFADAGKHQTASLSACSLAKSMADNPQVTWSFDQLLSQVDTLATQLRQAGCVNRNIIGISLPNSAEFVCWDLAAVQLGLVLQVFPEGHVPSADEQQRLASELTLWVHNGITLDTDIPQIDVREPLDIATLTLGADARRADDPDLFSLIYSSGTSGYLKGLKISQRGTERLINDFLRDFSLGVDDHHLIFLPLSNYQQRLSVYACLAVGCSLTITDFAQAFSQLGKAKPTFIIAPPALYENIFNTFSGLPDAAEKIRQFLGGRMRFMITGMAAIKPRILQAFTGDIGILLLEAYGVTETGMIAWNTPGANRQGTVGKAVHPDEVILNDESEIIIRRQYPLSSGYFQADAADARQTFLGNGDIATGDIASIDAQGFITLCGRKKEIITTAAGVKFHPEIVEKQLNQIDGVMASVVIWQPQRSLLYGIICIKDQGNSAVATEVEQAVALYNRQTDAWMKVAKLIITDDTFSIEAGTLTRNMKLNRKGIAAKYLTPHLQKQVNA